MTLHVGRYKALDTSSGKAVFQLAGGPGGSAIWESGIIPRVFDRMHQKFDIIYVDQRGTGGSDYLDCSQGYPSNETQWRACGAEHTTEPLNHDLTTDSSEMVRSCAKSSTSGGSTPSSTAAARFCGKSRAYSSPTRVPYEPPCRYIFA